MKKYKSSFSIQRIGFFRFYAGITIAAVLSFLLDHFFLGLIKLSDVIAAMPNEYWKKPFFEKPSFYYSFFWSLLSISLAFSFTIYLWTSKPILKSRRETRINRIAQANSFFIFGIIFLCGSRLLQFYVEFHNVDYKIKDEIGSLLFMLPIFIFAYNWTFISKIYKSKKTFLISLIIFIIYGLILSVIKT